MMPTGPIPEVTIPTNLYEHSRRRAKGRKIRKATAAACVTALLGVGGIYGLSQQSLRSAPLLVPASSGPTASPTPSRTQNVVSTTDAQLVAMTAGCDSACTVIGRVETRGNTFAIVGKTMPGGMFPNVRSAVGFVVSRDGQLISQLTSPASFSFYAHSPVTDGTGNVLVQVDLGNTSLSYLPFRLSNGNLTLAQSTPSTPSTPNTPSTPSTPNTLWLPKIIGDLNSGIVDADKDGKLEMVTIQHQADSGGNRVSIYRSWRWDGDKYAARPCSPTTRASGGIYPSCGLKAYPS